MTPELVLWPSYTDIHECLCAPAYICIPRHMETHIHTQNIFTCGHKEEISWKYENIPRGLFT